MKQILTTTLAALFFMGLQAQITIEASDFPQPDTEVDINLIEGPALNDSVDIGSPGANETYDFSKITNFSSEVFNLKYLSTATSPLAAAHPGSDIFSMIDFELDSLTQDTVLKLLAFINSTSTTFEQTGLTAVMDTAAFFNNTSPSTYDTFVVQFAVNDTVISTDYAFGHSETEFTSYAVTLGDITVKQQNFRTIEVDGWGTLTTPLGTFSVLRAKTIDIQNDTTVFNSIVVDASSDTTYTLDYFAKGVGLPIISADMDDAFTTVNGISYIAAQPDVVGIEDILAEENVLVFPNPASDRTVIQLGDASLRIDNITISNLLGQQVLSTDLSGNYADRIELDLSSLHGGTYFIQINGSDWQTVRKLVVRKN